MSISVATKGLVGRTLRAVGLEIKAVGRPSSDMEPEFVTSFEACKPYTCTSPERMYALYQATRYIVNAEVPGAVVECGVWRGGSMMMTALSLMKMGVSDRQIYMYDTFAGMTEPGKIDGVTALANWRKHQRRSRNDWCYASMDEVRHNMAATLYPTDKVQFVKGRVEDTIPQTIPNQIALLRLDTDWYQSTHHELLHLYPRLSRNGVPIIDDYGDWYGARAAVDEYLKRNRIQALLHRIDTTGRLLIKA